MSNSVTKKKVAAQKQNSHRLSNSKMLNVFSGINLNKINSTELVRTVNKTEEKQRQSSKRTARLKSGRTNQINLQFVLNHKMKQPYSIRSVQVQKVQKEKVKHKKRKTNKNSCQNSNFIIPFGDFSKSNSLIVFSQKNSTIDHHQIKDQIFVFSKKFTPNKAATIIQKNWRGYLTRKLLDQYILDQQQRLKDILHKISSKQQSIIAQQKDKNEQFEELSEIRDETMNLNEIKVYYSNIIRGKEESDKKPFVLFTTQNQSMVANKSIKNDSPPILKRSFFNNHKTQPDQTNNKMTSLYKSSKNLSFNFSIYHTCSQIILPENKQQQLSVKISQSINALKVQVQKIQLEGKLAIKNKLKQNMIDLGEMIVRNEKIKQIYFNSTQFLNDVRQQIMAIINQIRLVASDGVGSLQQNLDDSEQDNNIVKNKGEPKSQMFTIELPQENFGSQMQEYAKFNLNDEEQQNKRKVQYFSEGQLKLQTYLSELMDQYKQNYEDHSQLEYLCQILKINSEQGIKNILQRCLVQFTIQIITQNYPIGQLLELIYKQKLGSRKQQLFLRRWIGQLNKWEMGPIQQVTQQMQSSSFINGQSKLQILQEN